MIYRVTGVCVRRFNLVHPSTSDLRMIFDINSEQALSSKRCAIEIAFRLSVRPSVCLCNKLEM